MKKICIYGKGGIGKSTTVANLSAALADEGKKVAIVGCDPKADSTRCIMHGKIPTVLDQLKTGRKTDISFLGYKDIICIEAGGPEPGSGCAGRGVITAIEEIDKKKILEGVDVVIYDVLGDVVCGGFSMPLRRGIADEVYIVTTSDFMSLYAANNICRGIKKYAKTGEVRLAGIIHNGRSMVDNDELVEKISSILNTKVISKIPSSNLIGKSDLSRTTVVENYPDEEVTSTFRFLARKIMGNENLTIPTPITDEELEDICKKYI